MSEIRPHRAIGTRARGGYGPAKAQQQRPEHLVLKVFGGLVAGNQGARLPEVFVIA